MPRNNKLRQMMETVCDICGRPTTKQAIGVGLVAGALTTMYRMSPENALTYTVIPLIAGGLGFAAGCVGVVALSAIDEEIKKHRLDDHRPLFKDQFDDKWYRRMKKGGVTCGALFALGAVMMVHDEILQEQAKKLKEQRQAEEQQRTIPQEKQGKMRGDSTALSWHDAVRHVSGTADVSVPVRPLASTRLCAA